MKFKTVRDGQQALLYNHLGEARHIIGPERVFLFRKRLQYLKRHTASQSEYLVIKDRMGTVIHKPGPCEMFHNVLECDSIKTAKAIVIDANHVIVVYKTGKDNAVQRRIINGPSLFVPSPEEWLHEFKWHGTDPANKAHMIPGINEFTQLPVIPEQFYYNVRDVRTTDDTMITVKLMLFYSLDDIIKMLEATHDPIADMINAVCADVISFAGKLTYDGFVQKTHKLSSLETFPQLKQRAEHIGFIISQVVYRGYHASDQLQAMHDDAIQSRTQLRLNIEVQQQQQRLTDFKLNMEEARTKQRQDIEKSKLEHHQKCEQLKQEHTLTMKQVNHAHQLKQADLKTVTQLDIEKEGNEQQVEFLKTLKSLDVDLTEYLTVQGSPRVDQEIRVSQNSTATTTL